jgi:predicted aldo/keto reductase-like oxidoreductase
MLDRYAREMRDKYCRFCRTCEGRCPHGAAVADVMRYAMYFSGYGREKEAMRLYAALPRERSAGACATCPGPCEGACPFGRAIRAGMVAAHRHLSLVEA